MNLFYNDYNLHLIFMVYSSLGYIYKNIIEIIKIKIMDVLSITYVGCYQIRVTLKFD
jgi:hypothetical protein